MERGVYFDAWYPRQHCYHPSLPPRRLSMVDELEEYGATMLVWSALGGGSISLPYLEQEAWGPVPARERIYGVVNDVEFIEECGRRGIDVYGIVFEVQGWEFPVELNEDQDEILALNELRGAGARGWLGLREFNANAYPSLWKRWEEYFPNGLRNSDGQPVTDILEECVSRDIHGNALHATWVEAPDRDHYCYLMDRNNPVWREYLKAIIRIQVDAGVHGVQLDEAELPYGALAYGGCFCRDCMTLFRAYLQALPPGQLPEDLADTDLATFHYGQWLLERGYDFAPEKQTETPLFFTYCRFQRATIARYFAELADYAHDHARRCGREVKVSGNLYNLSPMYYPMERSVDVIVTERHGQRFRQPEWMRYAAGFGRDKPVVAVENPYGGVIQSLAERLNRGQSYDQFRMMQYEAAALGVNLSLPYGAWMGSVVKDSWHPPQELSLEIQRFFTDHAELYTTRTCAQTALVYSVESTFQLQDLRSQKDEAGLPFWELSAAMVRQHQPYDVIWFADGQTRADDLSTEDLAGYDSLVLADCRFLTPHQRDLLAGVLSRGGRLVVIGELGVNLDRSSMAEILEHPGTQLLADPLEFTTGHLAHGPQLVAKPDVDVAVAVHRVSENQVAIHLIRYDYDEVSDEVPVLPELRLDLRLPEAYEKAVAVSPVGAPEASVSRSSSYQHHLTMRDVPLYCVVVLDA